MITHMVDRSIDLPVYYLKLALRTKVTLMIQDKTSDQENYHVKRNGS
jgi:hypothetical protein